MAKRPSVILPHTGSTETATEHNRRTNGECRLLIMSVNKAIVVGNLGRDPEVRALPSGQSVVSFSIATTARFKDRNGEPQQRTECPNPGRCPGADMRRRLQRRKVAATSTQLPLNTPLRCPVEKKLEIPETGDVVTRRGNRTNSLVFSLVNAKRAAYLMPISGTVLIEEFVSAAFPQVPRTLAELYQAHRGSVSSLCAN
jgi:hypothetical protein